MKKYTVDIKIGDKIQVGRFRNVSAVVKHISLDQHGQPVIHTNKGQKKLFTFRLHKLSSGSLTPKQILKRKKNEIFKV